MGYQEECEAYALYGDPQRDAFDYEEAARYDRFDGWGDPDPCDDPDGRIDELPPVQVEPVEPVADDDVPF